MLGLQWLLWFLINLLNTFSFNQLAVCFYKLCKMIKVKVFKCLYLETIGNIKRFDTKDSRKQLL